MLVTKRDGTTEELDLNKIHAVLEWACNGNNDEGLPPIKGVSVSQIEMSSNLQMRNKIKTKEIHEILIKAAANLISEDTPNYDHVAARLVWFAVRKEAFKNHLPPHLKTVIRNNIRAGFYTKEILDWYDDEELDELNAMMRHNRDDLFRYAGAEQMRNKYLTQNRKTKQIYESFQFAYLMVAATLYSRYPKETRMQYVKNFYDEVSTHYLSLPTPIMAGVRTTEKQFSSCVVLKCGDSRESINKTASSILDYVSRKAGIGFDVGALRAAGQPVRSGDAVSTGAIPFLKYFNAALKSVSQGGIRSASATATIWGLHLEFESLIELKNNKGTEETRIRTLDYSVAINGLMYERLVNGGNITLFSPEEVPELYRAFYSPNVDLFRELYEKCEADPKLTKKVIPAMDYFTKLMTERFETGRIYIFHADLVNTHTPFEAPIYSSNLCQEIVAPTEDLVNENEMIHLCVLGAINWGKFTINQDFSLSEKDEQKLAKCCDLMVRALNELIDYQEYPVEAAKKTTMRYRSLGIGIIGFAHWLAKNKMMWGKDNTLQAVEAMMEKQSYYLTKATIDLAEERGNGGIEGDCKYKQGIFQIDNGNKPLHLYMPWDELRERAKKHGVMNAVLMALMPSETSSILSNETNGIEPPRALITAKANKDMVVNQVVPEFARYGHLYETLWNVETRDYLATVGALQKFVDQSISTNTSYDPRKGDITMSRLLGDLLFAYKKGIKTLYYAQVNDMNGEEVEDAGADGCAGGACKI